MERRSSFARPGGINYPLLYRGDAEEENTKPRFNGEEEGTVKAEGSPINGTHYIWLFDSSSLSGTTCREGDGYGSNRGLVRHTRTRTPCLARTEAVPFKVRNHIAYVLVDYAGKFKLFTLALVFLPPETESFGSSILPPKVPLYFVNKDGRKKKD